MAARNDKNPLDDDPLLMIMHSTIYTLADVETTLISYSEPGAKRTLKLTRDYLKAMFKTLQDVATHRLPPERKALHAKPGFDPEKEPKCKECRFASAQFFDSVRNTMFKRILQETSRSNKMTNDQENKPQENPPEAPDLLKLDCPYRFQKPSRLCIGDKCASYMLIKGPQGNQQACNLVHGNAILVNTLQNGFGLIHRLMMERKQVVGPPNMGMVPNIRGKG